MIEIGIWIPRVHAVMPSLVGTPQSRYLEVAPIRTGMRAIGCLRWWPVRGTVQLPALQRAIPGLRTGLLRSILREKQLSVSPC